MSGLRAKSGVVHEAPCEHGDDHVEYRRDGNYPVKLLSPTTEGTVDLAGHGRHKNLSRIAVCSLDEAILVYKAR